MLTNLRRVQGLRTADELRKVVNRCETNQDGVLHHTKIVLSVNFRSVTKLSRICFVNTEFDGNDLMGLN